MMRRAFAVFVFAVAVACLISLPVESRAEEYANSAMDTVLQAINKVIDLDLSDGNLEIESYEGEVSTKNEKFVSLLKAKIRLSRLFNELIYPEEDFTFKGGYEFFQLMSAISASGSHDLKNDPFNLADFLIFQIILPLELESLIRELPVYYDAVVSVDDWEEKMDLILETNEGWGPMLNRGKVFHLAGFPKVNKKKEFTLPIGVSTADDSLYYYDGDSSIEAWLYSFWMRRYHQGTMGIVKTMLDWLNERLDEVEEAVG